MLYMRVSNLAGVLVEVQEARKLVVMLTLVPAS